MRPITVSVFSMALLGVIGCPGTNPMNGAAEATRFEARLSGTEESTPVQTNATGTATFSLNDNADELSFVVTVNNVLDVTAAHIHIGPRGADGGVVVFLASPAEPLDLDGDDLELARGTMQADDLVNALQGRPLSELLDELRTGNAYVNVHTTANPNGEIRGQIEALENCADAAIACKPDGILEPVGASDDE